MVARLRLTPGQMATAWANPMASAMRQVRDSSALPADAGAAAPARTPADRSRTSRRMSSPPTTHAPTMGQMPNRRARNGSRTRPTTAAGTKAMARFARSRRPSRSFPKRPRIMLRILASETRSTARMAPPWMTIA